MRQVLLPEPLQATRAEVTLAAEQAAVISLATGLGTLRHLSALRLPSPKVLS